MATRSKDHSNADGTMMPTLKAQGLGQAHLNAQSRGFQTAKGKAHKLDETRHTPVIAGNGERAVTLFDNFSGRRLQRKAHSPRMRG